MESILEQITDQDNFDAFIQENMRLSTYVPLWKQEVEDVEYSATKHFSTYTASYTAAMVASMIEKNADKPLTPMDALGKITGSIARMGDRFQLDNDRLETLLQMEDRFRRRETNFTENQHKSEYSKIVAFLFNPYEKAAIAPHKRLDMLYYEGLSNGTFTVNLANNPQGIQLPTAIDLGIQKYGATGAVWNVGNAATMKPIEDINAAVRAMKAKGRIVTRLRMSQNTFNTLTASNQFNTGVKLTLGSIEVNPVGLLSVDLANRYLVGLGLPPISIEEHYVAGRDGAVFNMFKDDRIVMQCAPQVAKMVISDPLELRLPLPNRVYSSVEDNLISQYITENGRFCEYEMWGLPVFSGAENFAIIQTDTLQSAL